MIHVRTWSGSCAARIIDMTNAGKRGKCCRVLHFSGAPWSSWEGDDIQQKAKQYTMEIIRHIEALDLATSFDAARAVITNYVAKAHADRIPATYVNTDDREIRGIDAPVPELVHTVTGIFSAGADETGVSLHALNDPYNEWTLITAHGQKKSHAYRLAAKVWRTVQKCETLRAASDVLREAGCKLHGFCAVD